MKRTVLVELGQQIGMIAGLKRVAIALTAIAIVAVAGYYGWNWYDRSRSVQVTDDAYVRGEITAISPRVTGYATEVLVDDDIRVKAGQVIVRIDPRDFRVAVEKAQAALDQAKALLSQITAQRELQNSKITAADAALRSAEAQAKNADITLNRFTELLQKSAAPQATVDSDTAAAATAHASVDQATANLALEREQLVVIDANETAAKAQVAAAEANLLSSKFALDDTEIWSPIDGIVANRKTRVGEYVTAGTRMFSVVPINNLWIEANYRETQIGQMNVGDPVRVNIDTYSGRAVCGYVEAIAPASGSEFALIPPDNATGNFTKIVRRFTIRVRINARERNADLIRPGMSVETAIAVTGGANASASEVAARIGCVFDPAKDMAAERPITQLPQHPGLGRARPQGPSGIAIPGQQTP
jgi:membrane fusion protein, multidrug efflux system